MNLNIHAFLLVCLQVLVWAFVLVSAVRIVFATKSTRARLWHRTASVLWRSFMLLCSMVYLGLPSAALVLHCSHMKERCQGLCHQKMRASWSSLSWWIQPCSINTLSCGGPLYLLSGMMTKAWNMASCFGWQIFGLSTQLWAHVVFQNDGHWRRKLFDPSLGPKSSKNGLVPVIFVSKSVLFQRSLKVRSFKGTHTVFYHTVDTVFLVLCGFYLLMAFPI